MPRDTVVTARAGAAGRADDEVGGRRGYVIGQRRGSQRGEAGAKGGVALKGFPVGDGIESGGGQRVAQTRMGELDNIVSCPMGGSPDCAEINVLLSVMGEDQREEFFANDPSASDAREPRPMAVTRQLEGGVLKIATLARRGRVIAADVGGGGKAAAIG